MENKYIGCIEKINQEREGTARLAWLKPLAIHAVGDRTWKGDLGDTTTAFPGRGLVFWYDVPEEIHEGSFLQFTVKRHPGYHDELNKEAFQVDEFGDITEVIDLRKSYSEEREIRLALNAGVLKTPYPPLNKNSVILWIENDRWVGPLHLERGKGDGWTFKTSDPTRIDYYNPVAADLKPISISGSRLIVPSTEDVRRPALGERLGFRNWASDTEAASGILKRVRKLDRSAYEALDISYQVFDEYLEVIEKSELSRLDRMQEHARSERIVELRETIESNRKLLEEAATALLGSDQIKQQLEKEKQKILRELRAIAEAKVSSEFEEKTAELEAITLEIEKREDTLKHLDESIGLKQKELEDCVASFDAQLSAKLESLLAKPAKAFAEIAVIRAALGSHSEPLDYEPIVAASLASEVSDAPEAKHIIDEVSDQKKILIQRAAARKIQSIELIQNLNVAFLSGSVPIVAGTEAFDALCAFADTVANGRLLWIPVSGTTYEPADLFGRVNPSTGQFFTHPHGLLDVLVNAKSSNDLFIVVLEGFNRAPVENYLLPLLDSRSDVLRGKKPQRRIPIQTYDIPNKAYVVWPANVLLALLPIEGMTTLPLSRAIWRHACFLDCDLYNDDTLNSYPANEPVETSQVSASTWFSWSTKIYEQSATVHEQLLESDYRNFLRSTRDMMPSVESAARFVGSEKYARSIAASVGLLPRLAHESESSALQIPDLDAGKIEAITSSVARFFN